MFLKNKNIIFKIRISKVTDYAALKVGIGRRTTCADPEWGTGVWTPLQNHKNIVFFSYTSPDPLKFT